MLNSDPIGHNLPGSGNQPSYAGPTENGAQSTAAGLSAAKIALGDSQPGRAVSLQAACGQVKTAVKTCDISLGLASEKLGRNPFKIARLAKTCFANSRVLHLLVAYFERGIDRKKGAELASALMFPGCQKGALLYQRMLLHGLKPAQKIMLNALALYPGDMRIAQLWAAQTAGTRSLTLRERVDLYAFQVETSSAAAARHRAAGLFKRIAPFHLKNCDEDCLRQEIIAAVRQEAASAGHFVADNRQLADLFGVSSAKVQRYLTDAALGLNAQEQKQRSHDLGLVPRRLEHVLRQRLLHALRQLIGLENEMHRRGVIKAVSPREQLSSLFGVGVKEVKICLRFLPPEEWHYRERVFGNVVREERAGELAKEVRRELADWRAGLKTKIRSDAVLAKLLGVLPVAVHHYLNEELDQNEQRLRDSALRENMILEKHRSSLFNFVRQEIQAFHRGEINRLYSDHELGAIFNLSALQVGERLNAGQGGLSPAEQRLRGFALELQKPEDVISYAARREWLQFVTDRIERKARQTQKSPQRDESASQLIIVPRRRSRPRGRRRGGANKPAICRKYGYHVVFEGTTYGSYEEAALGALLGRYLGVELMDRRTVQVMVGGHAFDFFLPDERLLVEYHPIVLLNTGRGFGSFKNRADYENYLALKADTSLSKRRKQRIIAETKHRLYCEYFNQRDAIRRSDAAFQDCRLLVVTSPESFYDRVVAMVGRNIPSRETFMSDYRRQLVRVKRDGQMVSPWLDKAKSGA